MNAKEKYVGKSLVQIVAIILSQRQRIKIENENEIMSRIINCTMTDQRVLEDILIMEFIKKKIHIFNKSRGSFVKKKSFHYGGGRSEKSINDVEETGAH